MKKTFIGPHLRRLRAERGETQGQVAKALGISTSYVNLLENNERAVSVAVMLRLMEVYGVDHRALAEDDDGVLLADLRAASQDPLFEGARPDLPELRAALAHSPTLASAFLRLHGAWLAATEQLMSVTGAEGRDAALATSPESAVHDVFRRNRNHFRELEAAAEAFWGPGGVATDEIYTALKRRLADRLGLRVRVLPVAEMPNTLRLHDPERREVWLCEALDHPNRVFQLVHVAALVEHAGLLDALVARSGIAEPRAQARLRVELANYVAAAVLMPYGPFLAEARASKYDFDHLATRFGVTFEQACHRATTLQREGAQGAPFFFLRVDAAGNVTKRFNSTGFPLAEHGGACPRLEVHGCFRTPGRIAPQFVETPDGAQFFVFCRTVDRPTFTRLAQDVRLAVAMGCAIEHAGEIGYAEEFSLGGAHVTPVGITCRVCPRPNCDHRAHQAVFLSRPVDARRRGATRYDA